MSLDPAVIATLLHDPGALSLPQRATIARALAAPIGWTGAAVAQLAALWRAGASCSAIAAAINRDHGTSFSRNAVIGTVNRLGLGAVHPRAPGTGVPRTGNAERHPDSCPRVRQSRPAARSAHSREGSPSRASAMGCPVSGNPAHGVQAAAALAPPAGPGCSLMQLTDATCRWPVGDPGTREFHFCGGTPLAARPYCAYHAALAYAPEGEPVVPKRARRRRRSGRWW
jgi:GcrA cell cycle regulator